MRYLLDTCVISELVKATPDAGVVEWISQTDEEHLFLSVLTLGTLEKGIARLSDGAKKRKLTQWLAQDVFRRFEGRIIGLDADVLLAWGRIVGESESHGRPLPVMDSLFAATAAYHQLVLVTRNTDDVSGLGVEVLNPWRS